MSRQEAHYYEFGPFRLNAEERLLLRAGVAVTLTPKAFDTLLMLAQNSGHMLEKDELLKAIWADTFVEEATLAQNIFLLRKALGDDRNGNKYIETVPKRGYRFVASVREWRDEGGVPFKEAHTISGVITENGQETDSELRNLQGASAAPEVKDVEISAETETPSGSSIAEHLNNRLRHHKKSTISFVIALVILVSIAIGSYRLINQKQSKPSRPFQIARLTATGNIRMAAISPVGEYVVQAVAEGGRQSLWLRQAGSATSMQIAPPAEVSYWGLTFTPDGTHLNYIKVDEKKNPVSALYQMPVLGGAANKLIEDLLLGGITFSPDGRRLAFVRRYPDQAESALMVANADGSGQQRLATRKGPDFYKTPAWSPDGKTIACTAGSYAGGYHLGVVELPVAGGTERPITSQTWQGIEGLVWFQDGSGLMMTAWDEAGSLSQVLQLSYPRGQTRKITNDLNFYTGVSLTADSKTLATVKTDRLSNIWITQHGEIDSAKAVTNGVDRLDGMLGLSWSPNGQVVYASIASGNRDLWIIDPDGGNPKQLTFNTHGNTFPSVSPDGRYIVFVSDRAGKLNIWRVDADGGNPKQLTNGTNELFPSCSPDGKWVIYTSLVPDKQTLWKVAIDGGDAVKLSDKYSRMPVISPDGKLIACYYSDEWSNSMKQSIAIIPFNGVEPTKTLELPPGIDLYASIRWIPDGRALSYISTRRGVSNIWSHPLDGSPPKQLTDFKSDRILDFDWSRDGRYLAVARGTVINDVVLISDFK